MIYVTLNKAERYASGVATDAELAAARDAAGHQQSNMLREILVAN